MELNEYQKLACVTLGKQSSDEKQMLILSLGLCGESGEFADMMKKVHGHGHIIDYDKLKEELGDVLWYIATLCDTIGIDMETIAVTNVNKLKKRYPEGFSSERSINRNDSDDLSNLVDTLG